MVFLVNSNQGHSQCKDSYSGLIPIADLQQSNFNGFMGGKYPDGINDIPFEHYSEGMRLAKTIVNLNTSGKADSINGQTGMLILGYSTAAMTGRFFKSLCNIQDINHHLSIIIGAQGGRDINSMTDAKSDYWNRSDSAIFETGLSPAQIQVIWISSGDIKTYQLEFREQCLLQIEKYRRTLENIKLHYPNVKLVFLSDRPYAGYIGGPGEGPQELKEPTAYYNSWTIKWLIENQIKGVAGFTESDIPFIDWGPLLWTDGTRGNKQGYIWDCEDAGKGGIHATSKGRMKEAALLYFFFTEHSYTREIFKPEN